MNIYSIALLALREMERLASQLSAYPIQLCCEVTETDALPALENLLRDKRIDLVSLM
ncbi:MAG: hypothetical protein ACOCVH_01040 [Verrucomicrobiota bacterium]